MALAAPKTALPAAQQARKERIMISMADGSGSTQPVEAAAEVEAAAAAAAAAETPEAKAAAAAAAAAAEQVTLTRSEFNDLQAARDRGQAEHVAAEAAKLEASEARARLTELESARKETAKPSSAFDPGYAESDLAASDEDEAYEESEAFITKVVRREIKAAFAKLDMTVAPKIAQVEKLATETATGVSRHQQNTFVGRVHEAVKDVQELVANPHFADFLKSRVPMSTDTFNDAFNEAHAQEDLKTVKDIFDAFRAKYVQAKSGTAGYNGAAPTAAEIAPVDASKGKRYSLQERQDKSKAYAKGQISWKELQEYKVKFDEAQADGRVDV